MDYEQLLNESFKRALIEDDTTTKQGFLADHIFDIVTYDTHLDHEIGKDLLEVCQAITERTTYDLINNKAKYFMYINCINYPFFKGKISWGCSIRGAFWYLQKGIFQLESCGLFMEDKQLLSIRFNDDQWIEFMKALIKFSKEE